MGLVKKFFEDMKRNGVKWVIEDTITSVWDFFVSLAAVIVMLYFYFLLDLTGVPDLIRDLLSLFVLCSIIIGFMRKLTVLTIAGIIVMCFVYYCTEWVVASAVVFIVFMVVDETIKKTGKREVQKVMVKDKKHSLMEPDGASSLLLLAFTISALMFLFESIPCFLGSSIDCEITSRRLRLFFCIMDGLMTCKRIVLLWGALAIVSLSILTWYIWSRGGTVTWNGKSRS